MRVSYDWLKTMIDIPEDPKTLSDEYIRGDRQGAYQDPAPR